MFFLRKRKVILMGYIVLISLFACIYTTATYEASSPVMASPIMGKTIILDSGHGLPDSGAVRNKWNK